MRLSSLLLVAAAALSASPAAAQLATGSSAPVDITADELETTNGACTSIWRGHAEALQEDARLRADVLTIDFAPKPGGGAGGKTGACGDVTQMKADGSVYYVTTDRKVHGDNALYIAATNTLTVTGDVVATQGQNVLRGTKMVFNTDTGEGHMEGSATGRNKATRPRGVFYPHKQADNSSTSGASSTGSTTRSTTTITSSTSKSSTSSSNTSSANTTGGANKTASPQSH
jgi:lipopolysaccharide export system protein LptA